MSNVAKNKIKNISEILFFVLLNLFICIGPFCLVLLFEKIILGIIDNYWVMSENAKFNFKGDLMLVALNCIVFKYFFKVFAFPILYYFGNQFQIIHKFFNKFRTNLKFMFCIIGIAILLDCLSIFVDIKLCGEDAIVSIILNLLGLFPAYIIFLLFYPPVRDKNNIDEDGNIIEECGPIRKKIIKFVVYFSLVLFVIILFLFLYDILSIIMKYKALM